jgi:tetratricopeptide (TPR) repeat protein
MQKDHPTDGEIEFLLKHSPQLGGNQRTARVVRHLLADCSTCSHRVQRFSNSKDFDYSKAFAGAEHSLAAFFAQGKPPEASPELLLEELESLAAEERMEKVQAESRFGHPQLVECIIERSHTLRYQSPDEMLSFAHLAVLASERCSLEAAGSDQQLHDLRARSWMQYANALRVGNRFDEADNAFMTAAQSREKGTGDPLLRARLFEQIASLRTYQSRYREAIELAEEAGEVYRDLGENHSLASTMIQSAVATLYANDPEGAIMILNEAIPLIDPEKNPHLLLAACHNMVHSYITLDRPEQALSLYFETRSLYKDFEDDLILLRVGWQEGQLLRDLGHLEAAETALLQARKGFVEQNLSHEVALVSLDLAWVYVKLGRIEQLKRTVTEAIPIFQALRVGRETIAALLQLQHGEGQEQKALELIRLLNTRLSPLHRNTNK